MPSESSTASPATSPGPPSAPPRASRLRPPLAGLVPAVAVAVLVSLNGEASVDLGWHLETGRRILAGEGIPGPEPYLFTSGGAEWVDLHWLFQALVAAVLGAVGFPGLVLLRAALVAAAIGLAVVGGSGGRASAPLAALLGLLAAAVFTIRTGLRPEHLSYALLAGEIAILESVRRGAPPRRLLVALPLIQLVWTNSQGLFVLGVALQGAYLAGEWIAARVAARRLADDPPAFSPPARRALAGALALSVAAAFANPYFARGAAYPFTLATRLDPSDPLFRTIVELRPTLSFAIAPAATVAFVALLALGAAAIVLRPLRAPSLALAFAGLAALGAGAYRNAPLLPLAAVPLALDGLSPYVRPGGRAARAVAAAAILLASLVAADALRPGVAGPLLAAEPASIPRQPSGERPEAAAAFLESTGAGSRVFADSSDASWLTWRLRGSRKFFMDTRTEVVPEIVFAMYHALLERPRETFDAVAERDAIDAVVLDLRRPKTRALLHHLLDSKTFALAFASGGETVFLRRGAPALALSPPPEAAVVEELRARFPLAPREPR